MTTPALSTLLGLAQSFPSSASAAASGDVSTSTTAAATTTVSFSSLSSAANLFDTPLILSNTPALATSSLLPHNPLASIVHTNLQEWLKEGGDAISDDEGDEDISEEGEEDEEEGDAMEMDEGADEKTKSTTPSSNDKGESVAAASSTSASASSSSLSPSSYVPIPFTTPSTTTTPTVSSSASKAKKARKKRPSELLADDSAELGEILGAGYGGAVGGRSRGKMILLRRGTRPGKTSKLTMELEKKMGDANSAYINQDFGRAVDILLHIIQSAPNAQAPYHTLGLIYEERGEKSKAIEAYLLAAHMSKRDWGLWKRVGALAQECAEWQHAVYCWNRVLGAESENDDVRWQRSVRRREKQQSFNTSQ